ncbi:MAG: B12-binding domain-containing radical SAM protein [Candidatus Firestonebacteria bacterium]|nr:B12-binding domain-containing radical SAM protein [Candidatus Firestonebacteria bacterium]
MKILLVFPEFPETFWSFKHALKFVFKKSTNPPLGLLTVAGLLPTTWEKRLVDQNVSKLLDRDLLWADYVFLSGISIQKKSVQETLARCRALGVKVVAGGPLFTSSHEGFAGVDHFVLGEAELALPPFLRDLEKGRLQPIYRAEDWADLQTTPIPQWHLINQRKYASMSIQYSRGCPYNCDFCDITLLYGKHCRTKTVDQVIREMDAIYQSGWRGPVFFVDDNFIGNRKKLKQEILPAVIAWMANKRHPFSFFTQTSIDLADDDELMRRMSQAGFDTVFVGIETPNEMSLSECTKSQNKNRDLIACVKKIQKFGFQVQAGFIVGFDSDPATIFETQINFIQKSGIITAMVGLLNAMQGTQLYQRLKDENRLLKDVTGDNTDFTLNFIPKMDRADLLEGYRKIIAKIYSPKYFYARVKTYLKTYRKNTQRDRRFRFRPLLLVTFMRSVIRLGLIGKERYQYWKLLSWSLLRRPRTFPLAVTFSIYGFHYRKVFEKYI